MLNRNSNWSIADSKQCERDDFKRFHSSRDLSRAKFDRSSQSIIVTFENGRTRKYRVTRQKETADQGGWHNDYLGTFYTLKMMKAEAIEDVDTYAY